MKNIVGFRFGRLIVLHRLPPRGTQGVYWLCQCDCGMIKEVHGALLRYGETKSCGCLRREISTVNATKHGGSKTPEYRVWGQMIARCHNPNNESYKRWYGVRGIIVCDRWRKSFAAFYADMGPRPSRRHSIDRRNNNGNYEPDNCRWATAKEQRANQ